MKKIINGKMYNTETAERIAEDSNSLSNRDFNWYHEKLYKKKTGEFFLLGEGGPNTRWAERCSDNCWGYGEKIVPLSVDEAKEWLEKHSDADTYVEVFGPVEE